MNIIELSYSEFMAAVGIIGAISSGVTYYFNYKYRDWSVTRSIKDITKEIADIKSAKYVTRGECLKDTDDCKKIIDRRFDTVLKQLEKSDERREKQYEHELKERELDRAKIQGLYDLIWQEYTQSNKKILSVLNGINKSLHGNKDGYRD